MKKILLLGLGLFLFLAVPSASRAAGLKLRIQDFFCRNGEYVIRFGVSNTYSYEMEGIAAFKVKRGNRTEACGKAPVKVPAGADGSVVRELVISVSCRDNDEVMLESEIFDIRDRNRAGPWLSDCPK